MKTNKHQQNALKALSKKLDNLGETDAAMLALQIMNNDHVGMLKNPAYWK